MHSPRALEGVRVLDLSRILAGPWATQILADLGAEVIKIEKPGAGDDTRGWGPPFVPAGEGKSDAAYFLAANRNKRSVAIDISDPRGSKLVRTLAAQCQIVVENFKVGALERYGLDFHSLRQVRRDIVYCSITGFGQDGPYAHRAGYDYLVQAMGGLMSITGQPDGAAGAEPLKVGVAVADLFSGMYAVTGILAALRHAERTGEGQHLDISLLDCQVAMLANQAMNFLTTGQSPGRLGNAHPNITPYQVFPTQDGHLVLAVGNDAQFTSFCAVAGAPNLPNDPRFHSNPARVANREALATELAALFAQRTSAYWIGALESAGVPCGPINTIGEVFEDAQVQARGLKRRMRRTDGSEVSLLRSPLRLSETPPREDLAPPLLGADTRSVLRDLCAVSDDSLAALIDDGVVSERPND